MPTQGTMYVHFMVLGRAPIAAMVVALVGQAAWALRWIFQEFFEAYADAVGAVIETRPSNGNHCGVRRRLRVARRGPWPTGLEVRARV